MLHLLKTCVTAAVLFIVSFQVNAQANWPSPEVEQLYNKARENHSIGNLKQAISLYQQAILLAPDMMIIHRELGKAYYLAGGYAEARSTLEPIIKSGEADEQSYQALAACYSAENEFKKARKTLQEGMTHFQHSGILYHELGKLYEDDHDDREALKTWLQGIEADPEYHVNYYEAARMYMNTEKPVWAIIYGEMFINLEQQTPRSQETRKMLLAAYRRIYGRPSEDGIPKYGKDKKIAVGPLTFEQAVYNTMMKLAPVVSDGVTTENLTMLRTRFMMDWTLLYSNRFPFSLFIRQDDMIRNGYFDIYNQWLFGKAENVAQYDAWNKFHTDAMPDLQEWMQGHKFRPVAGDAYNDKQVNLVMEKSKG
ncbi:MAG: tetratricopeptide repeat protein [Sphingobacteriales bacterium]|nr:MAG: tetratricopeptide repeat protein [Sphingobacteriales bacterium]